MVFYISFYFCFIVRRKAAGGRIVDTSQTVVNNQEHPAQNHNDSIDSIDSPEPKEHRYHDDSIASPEPKEDRYYILETNPEKFSLKLRKINKRLQRSKRPLNLKRPHKSKRPSDETRFDLYNHFPIVDKAKSATRCKHPDCKNQTTHFYCNKCNVHLCLTKKRNCFASFHQK